METIRSNHLILKKKTTHSYANYLSQEEAQSTEKVAAEVTACSISQGRERRTLAVKESFSV